MTVVYAAHYKDRFGEEATSIKNDGQTLEIVIRGSVFRGRSFDDLETATELGPHSEFSMANGSLHNYVLQAEIPVLVSTSNEISKAILKVHTAFGSLSDTLPAECAWAQLRLELLVDGQGYSSRGGSEMFEGELLDIQTQLPANTHIKTCFTCAFSDYSPYGNPSFGGLACFRDNKSGYRSIKTKGDLFAIWNTNSGSVQEIHLCPEYELRPTNTGYRG